MNISKLKIRTWLSCVYECTYQCRTILYCLKILITYCSAMCIVNIIIVHHNVLVTTHLSNATINSYSASHDN